MGAPLRWDKFHELRKTRNGAVPLSGGKKRRKKKIKTKKYKELEAPTFEVGKPRVRKP